MHASTKSRCITQFSAVLIKYPPHVRCGPTISQLIWRTPAYHIHASRPSHTYTNFNYIRDTPQGTTRDEKRSETQPSTDLVTRGRSALLNHVRRPRCKLQISPLKLRRAFSRELNYCVPSASIVSFMLVSTRTMWEREKTHVQLFSHAFYGPESALGLHTRTVVKQ